MLQVCAFARLGKDISLNRHHKTLFSATNKKLEIQFQQRFGIFAKRHERYPTMCVHLLAKPRSLPSPHLTLLSRKHEICFFFESIDFFLKIGHCSRGGEPPYFRQIRRQARWNRRKWTEQGLGRVGEIDQHPGGTTRSPSRRNRKWIEQRRQRWRRQWKRCAKRRLSISK